MNASGLLQIRLTRNSIFDVEPTYSPDGKKIVFTTNRDSDSEIYRMSVADTNHDGQGDNPRNLTDISGQDSDPVYSPNKAKIAFQSNRDTNAEIYVMNATTGEPQVNLTQNVATDFEASWQALP